MLAVSSVVIFGDVSVLKHCLIYLACWVHTKETRVCSS